MTCAIPPKEDINYVWPFQKNGKDTKPTEERAIKSGVVRHFWLPFDPFSVVLHPIEYDPTSE